MRSCSAPRTRPLQAGSIRVNSAQVRNKRRHTKREDSMNWHNTLAGASLAVMAASTSALAQSPHIIAPSDQIVAVKAGHLFDSKSGEMLSNQVVLIKGDRVTDVGPNVQIPAG